MNKELTWLVFIVDCSGSMASIAPAMESGFREFVESQRKLPGECAVTLVRFNHDVAPVYTAMPLANVPPLEIHPSGNTALLDAMAITIDEVGAALRARVESQRPARVVVVTITDGLENASLRFKYRDVAERVQHQKDRYSWEFIFLGANIDALAEGAKLHTSAAMQVQASKRGVGAFYCALNDQVGEVRLRGAKVNADRMRMVYDSAMADAPVATKTVPDPDDKP